MERASDLAILLGLAAVILAASLTNMILGILALGLALIAVGFIFGLRAMKDKR